MDKDEKQLKEVVRLDYIFYSFSLIMILGTVIPLVYYLGDMRIVLTWKEAVFIVEKLLIRWILVVLLLAVYMIFRARDLTLKDDDVVSYYRFPNAFKGVYIDINGRKKYVYYGSVFDKNFEFDESLVDSSKSFFSYLPKHMFIAFIIIIIAAIFSLYHVMVF
ncbi:hypothetical protein [Fusobacterium sp. PH5-44]|uniref:hypothetical protein n=1 Tax=unclassified Fusobacterium TaxID=2648384 RepID=UPI003D1A16E3